MNNINEFVNVLREKPFIKTLIEECDADVYIVGGVVRDLIMGYSNKDVDIVIRRVNTGELIDCLSRIGKVNLVGKSFGVIKFTTDDFVEYDIALPRKERTNGLGGYHGFDIQSDSTMDIREDLIRRDVKFNAMAININTGDFIDPLNGLDDINNSIVSAANLDVFSDDPLRMLRIISFASRFKFDIDSDTLDMVVMYANRIKEIPSERILIEFDKIVRKGDVFIAADLLKRTGLLKHIFGEDGELYSDNSVWSRVSTLSEFIWLLSCNLVKSPHEYYKNVLKGDIDTTKMINALSIGMLCGDLDNYLSRKTVHKMCKIHPNILYSNILPINIKKACNEFLLGEYPKSYLDLGVNGSDLINMGFMGKEIGLILDDVLDRIYAEEIFNDIHDINKYIKSYK